MKTLKLLPLLLLLFIGCSDDDEYIQSSTDCECRKIESVGVTVVSSKLIKAKCWEGDGTIHRTTGNKSYVIVDCK